MYSQSDTKMGFLFYLLDRNTGKMLAKEETNGILGDFYAYLLAFDNATW